MGCRSLGHGMLTVSHRCCRKPEGLLRAQEPLRFSITPYKNSIIPHKSHVWDLSHPPYNNKGGWGALTVRTQTLQIAMPSSPKGYVLGMHTGCLLFFLLHFFPVFSSLSFCCCYSGCSIQVFHVYLFSVSCLAILWFVVIAGVLAGCMGQVLCVPL